MLAANDILVHYSSHKLLLANSFLIVQHFCNAQSGFDIDCTCWKLKYFCEFLNTNKYTKMLNLDNTISNNCFYREAVHGSSKVVNASVSLEPVAGDRVNKTTGCSLNTSNILQEVPLLVVAFQLKSTSTSPTDSPVVIHMQAVLITSSLCTNMILTVLLHPLSKQTRTTMCYCLDKELRTLTHA